MMEVRVMSESNGGGKIPRLNELAEFRFQLRSFLSFSEVASEACGIATQQYQLMQVIGSLPPGQQASISYIADRMILRHNSTVELVDRAEKAGLVQRKNDDKDLRRSLVQLTAHGRALLEQLVAQHIEELEKQGPTLVSAIQVLTSRKSEEALEG